jgi:hypothetical protein
VEIPAFISVTSNITASSRYSEKHLAVKKKADSVLLPI